MPEEQVLFHPDYRRGVDLLDTYIETGEDLLRFWKIFTYKEI